MKKRFVGCFLAIMLFVTMTFGVTVFAEEPDSLVLYYNFEGSTPFEESLAGEYNMRLVDGVDGDTDDEELDVVDSKEGYGKAVKLEAPESGNANDSIFIRIAEAGFSDAVNDTDFTLSFLLKGEGNIASSTPFCVGYAGLGNFIEFDVGENNSVHVKIVNNSNNWFLGKEATVDASSDWHAYTLTVKRASGADTITYYIDGIAIETIQADLPDYSEGSDCGSNWFNYVGKGFYCPTLNGLMDEIRFYNVALSADEVKTLANGTSSGDVQQQPEQPQQPDDTPETPKTGDLSVGIWMLMAACGATGMGLSKKMKK